MLRHSDVFSDSDSGQVVAPTPEQLARENMPLATFLAVEKARSATHVELDDL
ncbi:hypothetical protein HER21_35880, partial [Pseudomonas sp. BGM005]|nr:hypothetical protein [Pseudomonas sp. BG5]